MISGARPSHPAPALPAAGPGVRLVIGLIVGNRLPQMRSPGNGDRPASPRGPAARSAAQWSPAWTAGRHPPRVWPVPGPARSLPGQFRLGFTSYLARQHWGLASSDGRLQERRPRRIAEIDTREEQREQGCRWPAGALPATIIRAALSVLSQRGASLVAEAGARQPAGLLALLGGAGHLTVAGAGARG
jgi:hypothetical protein